MQWGTRQSQSIFRPTNHKRVLPANWRRHVACHTDSPIAIAIRLGPGSSLMWPQMAWHHQAQNWSQSWTWAHPYPHKICHQCLIMDLSRYARYAWASERRRYNVTWASERRRCNVTSSLTGRDISRMIPDLDCLLNSLFRLSLKKTSKFHIAERFVRGSIAHRHKGLMMQTAFPCHDVSCCKASCFQEAVNVTPTQGHNS